MATCNYDGKKVLQMWTQGLLIAQVAGLEEASQWDYMLI